MRRTLSSSVAGLAAAAVLLFSSVVVLGDSGEDLRAARKSRLTAIDECALDASQGEVFVEGDTLLTSSCDPWLRYSSPTAQTLYGVAWNGSRFVAVGGGGVVVTSTNGTTWSMIYPYPGSGTLTRVAWSGSVFAAVGVQGLIYTSQNGQAWTQRGSPTANELRAVAWNGNAFVAVGRGGTIVRSQDGSSWQSASSPTTADIYALTARGTTFVAIDDNGVVLRSPDGFSWSTSSIPGFPQYGSVLALTSTSASFVAVGFEVGYPNPDMALAYTSPDGVSWTRQSAPNATLRGVTWNGEKLVAVGDSAIMESASGTSWLSVASPLSGRIWDVGWGQDAFAAVGESGIGYSHCTTTQPTVYSYWVPVASHASGQLGSQWRTDLGLLNPGSATANVGVLWYSGGTVKSSSSYVNPMGQSILVDVVAQLGGTGSGALEVRSDQQLTVTSRTYNLVAFGVACYPNGTLGQDYPSFLTSEGLSAGQTATLGQLVENSASRTNIGLVNSGTTSASVLVDLFDGAGTSLTTYSVTLNQGEWKQETQPFKNKAGQTSMQRGWARVRVTSGSGVVAVASVVDNITNDPTTVPMRRQ